MKEIVELLEQVDKLTPDSPDQEIDIVINKLRECYNLDSYIYTYRRYDVIKNIKNTLLKQVGLLLTTEEALNDVQVKLRGCETM